MAAVYRRLHQLRAAAALGVLATRRLPLAQVIATVVHQPHTIPVGDPEYSPRYNPLWGDFADPHPASWDCSVYVYRQGGVVHVYMDCCSWSEDGARQEYKRLFFEVAGDQAPLEPLAFCYVWSRDGCFLRYTEDLADVRPWHRALLATAFANRLES